MTRPKFSTPCDTAHRAHPTRAVSWPRTLLPALLLVVASAACGEDQTGESGEEASLSEDAARARRACDSVPAQIDGCAIAGSIHAALGMPTDGASDDDYWMDKDTYVLSYNPEKRVANWVSWRLRAEDMGPAARSGKFRTDLTLPAPFERVTRTDYANTGFDRGHLCPSKERTRNERENISTFLMTNIHPQVPELNMGPWSQLEEYEQERAERASAEVYIVAGPIFDATYGTIGPGIAVPRADFRIVVELESGQTIDDIRADTEIIAVIMPNDPGVEDHDWSEYRTTVDAIEAETGYDFFAALPSAIEDAVEAR